MTSIFLAKDTCLLDIFWWAEPLKYSFWNLQVHHLLLGPKDADGSGMVGVAELSAAAGAYKKVTRPEPPNGGFSKGYP